MNSADAFIRIEKGHADPDELAALTVVLLARAAAQADTAAPGAAQAGRTPVRWRRRDRGGTAHATARGWRDGAGPARGGGTRA